MEKRQRLLNFDEAAAYLGIKEAAFRMRVNRGIIPPHCVVKIGGRYHIDLKAFDKWIDTQRLGKEN